MKLRSRFNHFKKIWGEYKSLSVCEKTYAFFHGYAKIKGKEGYL